MHVRVCSITLRLGLSKGPRRLSSVTSGRSWRHLGHDSPPRVHPARPGGLVTPRRTKRRPTLENRRWLHLRLKGTQPLSSPWRGRPGGQSSLVPLGASRPPGQCAAAVQPHHAARTLSLRSDHRPGYWPTRSCARRVRAWQVRYHLSEPLFPPEPSVCPVAYHSLARNVAAAANSIAMIFCAGLSAGQPVMLAWLRFSGSGAASTCNL
jgi:hypothetical protein